VFADACIVNDHPLVSFGGQGCLAILINAHWCSAGFPIISHFTEKPPSTLGGFNLGGINASGQVRETMSLVAHVLTTLILKGSCDGELGPYR
jgi:hypothetical protein